MIHYLHIAYHGQLKDRTCTFDGDILVAIEKCTLLQLREGLMKMLEDSGIEVETTPTIMSITELKPDLFKMLYGDETIKVIKIEE